MTTDSLRGHAKHLWCGFWESIDAPRFAGNFDHFLRAKEVFLGLFEMEMEEAIENKTYKELCIIAMLEGERTNHIPSIEELVDRLRNIEEWRVYEEKEGKWEVELDIEEVSP